mmetsp:Transcript_12555/g.29649  ORF Transcript_12555/g.29649 Transcript_12555/m.29649 type:complete len:663 (-) Transcript_12555:1320-3308(-)
MPSLLLVPEPLARNQVAGRSAVRAHLNPAPRVASWGPRPTLVRRVVPPGTPERLSGGARGAVSLVRTRLQPPPPAEFLGLGVRVAHPAVHPIEPPGAEGLADPLLRALRGRRFLDLLRSAARRVPAAEHVPRLLFVPERLTRYHRAALAPVRADLDPAVLVRAYRREGQPVAVPGAAVRPAVHPTGAVRPVLAYAHEPVGAEVLGLGVRLARPAVRPVEPGGRVGRGDGGLRPVRGGPAGDGPRDDLLDHVPGRGGPGLLPVAAAHDPRDRLSVEVGVLRRYQVAALPAVRRQLHPARGAVDRRPRAAVRPGVAVLVAAVGDAGRSPGAVRVERADPRPPTGAVVDGLAVGHAVPPVGPAVYDGRVLPLDVLDREVLVLARRLAAVLRVRLRAFVRAGPVLIGPRVREVRGRRAAARRRSGLLRVLLLVVIPSSSLHVLPGRAAEDVPRLLLVPERLARHERAPPAAPERRDLDPAVPVVDRRVRRGAAGAVLGTAEYSAGRSAGAVRVVRADDHAALTVAEPVRLAVSLARPPRVPVEPNRVPPRRVGLARLRLELLLDLVPAVDHRLRSILTLDLDPPLRGGLAVVVHGGLRRRLRGRRGRRPAPAGLRHGELAAEQVARLLPVPEAGHRRHSADVVVLVRQLDPLVPVARWGPGALLQR